MNKEQSQSARTDYFRTLYENARDRFAESDALFLRHMQQYRGSDELDGSKERAGTVRNITYEIVESQVSSEIPPPKVEASCYSEKKDRNAKSVERLCASVRDMLPFEEMNDMDERYTYIYGGSVFLVEWENPVGRGGDLGGIRVCCLSPRDFIPQPNITKISDMDYCFLRFVTTKAELTRRYGVSEEDLARADIEWEELPSADAGEAVTVILCFYRDEEGEVGEFIFSGELALLDLPNYYRRKRKICRNCGREAGLCVCKTPALVLADETHEVLDRDIVLSDGTVISSLSPVLDAAGCPISEGEGFRMERTRLPYYVPKDFPIVIRKNTSGEKSLFGQSDCEYIRPEQQAINKVETRILQKLLRAGITPVLPEDATVSLNNSVFGQVIRMKPGESLSQYGKVDTTPDISQDIAEAERLYAHAKRTLGISDAYQGINYTGNESGYARELRIRQASGRLESKRKMKHTAYADIDRLIFRHFLAFADEPRKLSYRDAYGRIHDAMFNRYDFLDYDTKTGEYFYDDGYLFSIDPNGGIEGRREEIWEKNLENLRAGALGDPSDPMTLLRYWQCQERAHYPYARENVEYFGDTLEKATSDLQRKETV